MKETKMMCICSKAEVCDNSGCKHRVTHEFDTSSCSCQCEYREYKSTCILVNEEKPKETIDFKPPEINTKYQINPLDRAAQDKVLDLIKKVHSDNEENNLLRQMVEALMVENRKLQNCSNCDVSEEEQFAGSDNECSLRNCRKINGEDGYTGWRNPKHYEDEVLSNCTQFLYKNSELRELIDYVLDTEAGKKPF